MRCSSIQARRAGRCPWPQPVDVAGPSARRLDPVAPTGIRRLPRTNPGVVAGSTPGHVRRGPGVVAGSTPGRARPRMEQGSWSCPRVWSTGLLETLRWPAEIQAGMVGRRTLAPPARREGSAAQPGPVRTERPGRGCQPRRTAKGNSHPLETLRGTGATCFTKLVGPMSATHRLPSRRRDVVATPLESTALVSFWVDPVRPGKLPG